MTIVFFALLGIFTLYFWLRGNWFGRVLAFLALTCAFVPLGLCLVYGHDSALLELAAILGGAGLAWIVAAIPGRLTARRRLLPVLYPPAGAYPPGTAITLR